MKGSYCLIIELKKDSKIKIGKLGYINFRKGFYVYIGSAMSSLESRIKRHLSSNKKKHWYIDYLLLNTNSQIKEVLFNISDSKIECDLAKLIGEKEEEIMNFGSSDCKCNSHLIYFKTYEKSINSVVNSYETLNMDFKDLNYFKKII
ncbi:GIY-YIG nuclease family protein [Methanobrevibacter sp. OttesenSCG-928-K11]|nr:GIY-YIG nuclease family protein [Methanobrevibacter sp. OttesenSCG-928-K11]